MKPMVSNNKDVQGPYMTAGLRLQIVPGKMLTGREETCLESELLAVFRGGWMGIRQTDPPLSSHMLGKPLHVTFVLTWPHGQRLRRERFGFRAVLSEVADGFAPGERMLVLAPPNRLTRTTLRMFTRVRPPHGMPLHVDLRDTDWLLGVGPECSRAKVLDVSRGGLRLNVAHACGMRAGRNLGLMLHGGGRSIPLRGEVVRVTPLEEQPGYSCVRIRAEEPRWQRMVDELVGELKKNRRAAEIQASGGRSAS